jgi:hypothetical protein
VADGRTVLFTEGALQRIWPLAEENRTAKIAQFAKKHELQLSFYKQGLCAIFEKESDPKRKSAS